MRRTGTVSHGMGTGRAALRVVAMLVATRGALAAEPTGAELREARELFSKAQSDEKAGDWPAALEKLKRVTQIKVTPGVRFHVAVCEEKTGQLVAALADYALAERQAAEEKNREVLSALKEPIAALQERVPRLLVKAPTDVKGLEVALDGKALAPGLFSAEMPVDAKAHTVEAHAPGRKAFSQTVTAREREITPVEIVLEPEGKATPAPVPIATSKPSATPLATPAASTTTKPTPTPPPAGGGKTLAIVATAGAVVLVGAGVGAFLVADGAQSDFRAQCPTRAPGACEDLKTPVHTWDTLALGAWIGGAALTTVAIIAWAKPSAKGTSGTSGRFFVAPAAAGLAGTF